MGIIKDDVFEHHLSKHPEEESLLDLFVQGFDINWARRRKTHNTEVSLYFIKPEQYIVDLFGFDYEIALFITSFETIEPRTIQAVEALIGDSPAKGRVDQTVYFLMSKDDNAEEFVANYMNVNPQSRIPVIFSFKEADDGKSNSWYLRNKIIRQLYSRDLFDYQLPLDNDMYFFGRDAIVADHIDAIKKSQNRGIFGLRKTGKTSIIYKIGRTIERESIGKMFYYDCKDPYLRMKRWCDLLGVICEDIMRAFGIELKINSDPLQISRSFKDIVSKVPENMRVVLVFDEIEYISPLSTLDEHWKQDFIPFWQTLWSVQSQIRRLTNIVAGVNPSVAEMDLINDIQNPMFGIIQPKYIRGLSVDELRSMVRFFGKRMGIPFIHDAIDYLHARYGGHPLLSRLACSFIHNNVAYSRNARPFEVSTRYLQDTEEIRDSELVFYCRHVVSELRKFYPHEYEMLEMLASGHVTDFMDLQFEPEFTRHLREYGLIDSSRSGKPVFAIPVIERFIAIEFAKREGRKTRRKLIANLDRKRWLDSRLSSIVKETTFFESLLKKVGLDSVFGGSPFPELDRFIQIVVVTDQASFVNFINICNRCLVESVKNFGKNTLKNNNYYWNDIKFRHVDLWNALRRINLYRNNDLHLELDRSNEEDYKDMIRIDLEGRRITQVEDPWFMLQQCTLDELFVALQCEINSLT